MTQVDLHVSVCQKRGFAEPLERNFLLGSGVHLCLPIVAELSNNLPLQVSFDDSVGFLLALGVSILASRKSDPVESAEAWERTAER